MGVINILSAPPDMNPLLLLFIRDGRSEMKTLSNLHKQPAGLSLVTKQLQANHQKPMCHDSPHQVAWRSSPGAKKLQC